MGLISAAKEQQSLALGADFGRSTLYLTTDYDDALSQSLFLHSDGQPREASEYEQIGRKAMQLLIQPGGDDEFRLRPLQNDAIWQQVKATGGTVGNLAQVFPDLSPDSQIPIIAGDYVLIAWWAATMANMGQSLSAAKRFFTDGSSPRQWQPGFRKSASRFVASNGGRRSRHARSVLRPLGAAGNGFGLRAEICSERADYVFRFDLSSGTTPIAVVCEFTCRRGLIRIRTAIKSSHCERHGWIKLSAGAPP